jgi:hypothetical protein
MADVSVTFYHTHNPAPFTYIIKWSNFKNVHNHEFSTITFGNYLRKIWKKCCAPVLMNFGLRIESEFNRKVETGNSNCVWNNFRSFCVNLCIVRGDMWLTKEFTKYRQCFISFLYHSLSFMLHEGGTVGLLILVLVKVFYVTCSHTSHTLGHSYLYYCNLQ